MVQALKAAGVHRVGSATVIGGGATAASTLAAVAKLGAHRVTVAVRTPERTLHLQELAAPLNLDVNVLPLGRLDALPRADVVVSTIPAQAQADLADVVVESTDVVFDVIYYPRLTPLLSAATARGLLAIPGFELLLHQAGRQVELMTRTKVAPLDEMRTAGLRALDSR